MKWLCRVWKTAFCSTSPPLPPSPCILSTLFPECSSKHLRKGTGVSLEPLNQGWEVLSTTTFPFATSLFVPAKAGPELASPGPSSEYLVKDPALGLDREAEEEEEMCCDRDTLTEQFKCPEPREGSERATWRGVETPGHT